MVLMRKRANFLQGQGNPPTDAEIEKIGAVSEREPAYIFHHTAWRGGEKCRLDACLAIVAWAL